MDTMSAFARGEANCGKPMMVFDWDKAAREIVARGAKSASAGLHSDWEYTGGEIFRAGEPVTDSCTYLSSTWATPELKIDGETIDCFRVESETDGWGSGTKWPESALKILRGEQ